MIKEIKQLELVLLYELKSFYIFNKIKNYILHSQIPKLIAPIIEKSVSNLINNPNLIKFMM